MNSAPSLRPATRRLLVPLISGLMVLLVGFVLLVSYLHRQHLNEISRLTEQKIITYLEYLQAEHSLFLKALAEPLAQNPVVAEALKARDARRLLAGFGELATSFNKEYGVTHFYFHTAERDVLLRVYKPETVGGRVNRFTVREAERTGRAVSGLELGPMGTLTLRVVRPVFDGEARLAMWNWGWSWRVCWSVCWSVCPTIIRYSWCCDCTNSICSATVGKKECAGLIASRSGIVSLMLC